jgi:hypothetical protein
MKQAFSVDELTIAPGPAEQRLPRFRGKCPNFRSLDFPNDERSRQWGEAVDTVYALLL